MRSPKIFESEYRFCKILWENEPIKSGDLARLCAEQLGWKTTTTYTVIKRLSDRGVIKNEHTVVSSLVSRQEAEAAEIEELIEKRFDSSVPGFLAAFTKNRRLNAKEIAELQQMIDRFRKEHCDA
ncbi:MAG: BlaI/MecI/CopY family transcriptional regulator [Oscillospiraceae bacterium]|nr:BlaI/MecI/CopY family transcriptional regulator [Oscillospiraceae bacterium]